MHGTTDKLFLVIAAHGLAKPDDLSLPDPFAVVVVDSVQTHTMSVIKQTLHPYWNEHFDVSVFFFQIRPVLGPNFLRPTSSMVKRSSVVTVQIFDQRKLVQLERDQGFLLGFIELRVTDYLDLELGGQGIFSGFGIASPLITNQCIPHRASSIRSEGHRRQSGRARQIDVSPLYQPYHVSNKFPSKISK